MTRRSRPSGDAKVDCEAIIEPGIEEPQALAGARENDRGTVDLEGVPLLAPALPNILSL